MKKLQRRVWPIYLLLVILFPYLLWQFEFQNEEPLNPFLLVGLATGIFLILFFIAKRASRRIRDRWATYSLRLDETRAVRRQFGATDFELHRDDVTRITEKAGKGMTLHTSNPLRSLFIPAGIENYEHARAVLVKWGKLESR